MRRSKVLAKRNLRRIKRRRRINVKGTVEVPRVTVFKSNKYFYAQAIDDVNGHTLAYADGAKHSAKSSKEGAKQLAKIFADELKAKNIESIKFDRNGYKYHGVVAAFADTLRENGIKF